MTIVCVCVCAFQGILISILFLVNKPFVMLNNNNDIFGHIRDMHYLLNPYIEDLLNPCLYPRIKYVSFLYK